MRKITIIFMILLVLLLLTACNKKQKTQATGFIGGEEGLKATIAIESTSGGNKVYDAGVDPFKIDITLENKGEGFLESGDVLTTLSGISFDAFSIVDQTQKNTLPLPGRRREPSGITEPSQTIVQYDANYKPDADADRNVDVVVDLCYKYQTTTLTDVCLKNKVTGPTTGELCKIEEVKLTDTSGSPIKVKRASERPAGEQKVHVLIEAENLGKGNLYQKDYLTSGSCVDSVDDKNKLHVKVELPDYLSQSPTIIKCAGLNGNEGDLSVIQNKIQLSCEIDTTSIGQETAFETPLRATFSYVYKDSVKTTITVKSSI